jgi:hypothetical protein
MGGTSRDAPSPNATDGRQSVKYSEWAESFQIFAKYGDGAEVTAGHDEMWAGPSAEIVAEADRTRLSDLGWRADTEGGFQRFRLAHQTHERPRPSTTERRRTVSSQPSRSNWSLMPGDRVLLDNQTPATVVSWGRGSDGGIAYRIQPDRGDAISNIAARRLTRADG